MLKKEIKTAEDALEAIQDDGYAIQFVPERLRTAELCLKAVQNSFFSTLKYVPQNLKTTEMCWAAVKKNGYNLADVPENLRTTEMCLAAAECIHEMNKDLEEAIEAISHRSK
ncbi:MAG: DUF4116 domain-containing protein [Fibromonadales bacterium]|nr:DUF4116 domain-containing protein [Fibromonadales bacterium]